MVSATAQLHSYSVKAPTAQYKQIGLAVFQLNLIYKNRRGAWLGPMGQINPCNQPDRDGKPLEGYMHLHFSTFSMKQEVRSPSNKGRYIFGETEIWHSHHADWLGK